MIFLNSSAAVPPPTFRSMSKLKFAALALVAASLAGAAMLWQPAGVVAREEPAANTPEFYTQRVLPIFQTNCYRCHGGFNHRGDLSMETRAGLLKGGHKGAAMVPGNAEQSLLIKLIRHQGPIDDPMPMPPKSKISDDDIATVSHWIQAGAIMPPDRPVE